MPSRIRRWFGHLSSSSHWRVMELQSLVKKVTAMRFKGFSCRIRAVERRKSAAGQARAHPGLHDWTLLNYRRIENAHAHKVRKKTFDFLLFIDVQQTFSLNFFLLRHY